MFVSVRTIRLSVRFIINGTLETALRMSMNIRKRVMIMVIGRGMGMMVMNIRIRGVMLAWKLVREGIIMQLMIKFRRRVVRVVIIMGVRGRSVVLVRIFTGGHTVIGFRVRRMVLNIRKGGMM